MVQYIEHNFQQFVNVNFVDVVKCIGKKWLFWLCEGSALRVGAKPNVPLAGWLKLFLKKCAVEKKNIELVSVSV